MVSRRIFLVSAPLALLGSASLLCEDPAPTTRLNVAEIDHNRILAGASRAMTRKSIPNPDLQSAAFLDFTLDIPALAAAAWIDPGNAARYATQAGAHLEAWLLTPATRPTLELSAEAYEPLIALAPLAEMAVALPFLPLEPGLMTRLKASFAKLLSFLMEDRTSLLARDAKNHHASSWLLQVAAYARLTGNEAAANEARHRFKTVTIRAQIDAAGLFPHELRDANPFRDSLFNLDLLAGACTLLSTRFESLWEHELQDGPGMRVAVARHAAYIRDRHAWPYPADEAHFNQLPARRPALLFAARAYSQADYATLWRTLNPDPTEPDILRTFPIRQPVLWVNQPKSATGT